MTDTSDEPLSALAKALMESNAAPRRDFATQFSFHSERGAALAAVAKVDEALGAALKANMADVGTLKDWLFDGTGPLGSFGLKIRLGYATAMYSRMLYDELKIIEDVRNLFAHKAGAHDFRYPKIQGKCSSMILMRVYQKMSWAAKNAKSDNWPDLFPDYDLDQPSYMFLATCEYLAWMFGEEARAPAPLRQPIL